MTAMHVQYWVSQKPYCVMEIGPAARARAGWGELLCRRYEQVAEEINVQGPVARSVGRSVLLPKASQFFVCTGNCL